MRDLTPQQLITWFMVMQDKWYVANIITMKPRGENFDRFYCNLCRKEYQSPFSLVFSLTIRSSKSSTLQDAV